MNELALRELALFAGSGGGILGGSILRWRTRCAVEIDAYARSVLLARQRDGCLPRFPIWDDIQTFDGRPWRGSIDVVSGGFPCQDVSAAGKGAGITGARSGLWSHMARVVGEVGPRFVFVENSPMLVHRGLAVVLSDLAQLGYDAVWCVLGACDAIWDHCDPCADHQRARIWILAFPNTMPTGQWRQQWKGEAEGDAEMGHAKRPGLEGQPWHGQDRNQPGWIGKEAGGPTGEAGVRRGNWWESEPNLGGVAHGLAVALDQSGSNAISPVGRVGERIPKRRDRIRCIGNGQVPVTAAMAFRLLLNSIP